LLPFFSRAVGIARQVSNAVQAELRLSFQDLALLRVPLHEGFVQVEHGTLNLRQGAFEPTAHRDQIARIDSVRLP